MAKSSSGMSSRVQILSLSFSQPPQCPHHSGPQMSEAVQGSYLGMVIFRQKGKISSRVPFQRERKLT